MKPDPLEKVKPDHPVFLISTTAGIIVTTAGLGTAVGALAGWRPYYTPKGAGLPPRNLTFGETLASGAFLLIAGIALFLIGKAFRRRG